MFYENKAGQAGVVLLLLAVLIAVSIITYGGDFEIKSDDSENTVNVPVKDHLNFWYSDESMGDYYLALCDRYFTQTGIRVTPICVSGVDYLMDISENSEAGMGPDVYELPNSSLWEADMLSAASEIPAEYFDKELYHKVTEQAVTCNDKRLGMPIYYETAFLICNNTYLQNYARDQIESQAGENLAEAAEGEPAEYTATAEEIRERVETYIPADFDQLKEFADNFDAPEGVRAVLGWDTNDVFFDFFVLGASINIAGKNGDDEDALEIVNGDSIDSMEAFQELTAFFSIDDEETVTYSAIRDAFCNGEFVFAIVGPDVLKYLDSAKAAGKFDYDYRVCALPNIKGNIPPAALSMTQCICVNSASEDVTGGLEFASFAAKEENAQLMYDLAGKLSPLKTAKNVHEGADRIQEEYARSVSAPKILSRSDYWMRLEIAFMQVQNGTNTKNAMKNLEKTLK